jgi:hypothetical protein
MLENARQIKSLSNFFYGKYYFTLLKVFNTCSRKIGCVCVILV